MRFKLQKTEKFESELLAFIKKEMIQDPAHDINHILRVVKTAKELCEREKGKLQIVLPAAYLHDCFFFPKNHPDRAKSSEMAADKAIQFLKTINYPEAYFGDIHHAIMAHSFSANIKPRTLEAQIVQDADRLDSLGAIGIARCLQVNTILGLQFYNSEDTFCEHRKPDDAQYAVDHFYVKLFKLAETMNTESAKLEAQSRTQFMRNFLYQLETEVSP